MRRLKRILSLLSAAALLAAPASPVFAAEGSVDDNKYTVVLRYDDNVQINYQHIDPAGLDEWWRGAGDIPIGGASLNGDLAISQLYCVDAAVPFHSKVADMGGATTRPGNKTTDTVPDYVAVAPDTLPDALRLHWNELSWLMLNGYSDAASVNALNDRYKDLKDKTAGLGQNNSSHSIPDDVALMATKVAVWHFTNPEVAYYSTSFFAKSVSESDASVKSGLYVPPQKTESGIKHRQFAALTKRLIEDAIEHGAEQPSDSARIKLKIEKTAVSTDKTVDEVIYRGPYKILNDDGTLGADDPVFLNTDPQSGINFYTKDTDGSFKLIPKDLQKYGDNATNEGAGIAINKDFYIGDFDVNKLDGISISALARATTAAAVTLPVVLVHQDPQSGKQNWDDIQAFIGLAGIEANTTVYGQAFLPLHSEAGEIQISKSAADTNGAGKEFSFRLTDDKGKPVKLGDLSMTPAIKDNPNRYFGDGSDGVFKLTVGSTVTFGLLPLGNYKITEFVSEDFSVAHKINSETEARQGRTAEVTLQSDGSTAIVDFTNTYVSTPPPPLPPVPVPPTPVPPVPTSPGDPVPQILLIAKHSSRDGKPLAGATFTLAISGEEGEAIPLGVTNAHGVLSAYLPPISAPAQQVTYILTETRAPSDHSGPADPLLLTYVVSSKSFAPQTNPGGIPYELHQDTDSGVFIISMANTYNPPPPLPQGPGPNAPTPPTPEEETPPAPENPTPPETNTDTPPYPGTPQEVTPPDTLPQTGGAAEKGARALAALAFLLTAAAPLSVWLWTRRRAACR
jgi:hypothetical protein